MLLWTLLLSATQSLALDNGLGLTPQMGWNSWNHYHCSINQTLIQQSADALVSSGLAKAGYNYVNLDDCWEASERNADGELYGDPTAFPDGMKALGDYIHNAGLLYGVYSSAGTATCQGRPASLGYETVDAQSFADWGVDYLKYDNCNNEGIPPTQRYPVMRDALNATGRKIFYSICEWGREEPALWGPETGNSWRTTGDIEDAWISVLTRLELNNVWWKYAGPGGWNDPDMLEVGNGRLTYNEEVAHFSLWALVKAPLLVGCDVTSLSQTTLDILTNTEVIAVNQDAMGEQGRRISIPTPGSEVWAGPLASGAWAVVLLNTGFAPVPITCDFTTIGFDAAASVAIRDLWLHQDMGTFTGSYTATVQPHGVVMFTAAPTSWSKASWSAKPVLVKL